MCADGAAGLVAAMGFRKIRIAGIVGVGLWLAAVWGAVVWLTAAVSMAAVEAFFPQIYGGSVIVVAVELALLCCYLVLAMQSAREHPH